MEKRKLKNRSPQVDGVRQRSHHAVGVSKREIGLVRLVSERLRNIAPGKQPRQVQLAADRTPPIGEIDGRVTALPGLQLYERDKFLDLREQRRRETGGRKARLGRIKGVSGRGRRDLDQDNADAGDRIRQEIEAQRRILKPAGGRGCRVVQVRSVEREGLIGPASRLPEIPKRLALCAAHRPANHKPPGAGSEIKPLLDLGVGAAKLMRHNLGLEGGDERILSEGRKRSPANADFWDADGA